MPNDFYNDFTEFVYNPSSTVWSTRSMPRLPSTSSQTFTYSTNSPSVVPEWGEVLPQGTSISGFQPFPSDPPPAHPSVPSTEGVSFNPSLDWYFADDSSGKRKSSRKKVPFQNSKVIDCINVRGGKKTGLIGLEIECEGTNLFSSPFMFWACHEDGSLRPYKGHPPQEYVLTKPLDLDKLQEAFDYLREKLEAADSVVVPSSRTSVHVHINCQEILIRELFCFILLYIIFEELLVEWSGPERAGNLFCLRAKDSDFYINMLENALKKESFQGWREDYRYAACNIASITKFGSLEFRSMRGTVDFELITNWINLLVTLKEKASEYQDPTEIVREFQAIGPLPFFKKIFSDEKQRRLLENIPELTTKLWNGLRLMRDVAYSVDWVDPTAKKKEEVPQVEEEPVVGINKRLPREGDRIQIYVPALQNYYRADVGIVGNGRWNVRYSMGAPRLNYEILPGHFMAYACDIPGDGSTFYVLAEGPREAWDEPPNEGFQAAVTNNIASDPYIEEEQPYIEEEDPDYEP